jgi:hypothetical protein
MQLHQATGNTNDSIVIYSDDIRAQNGSKSYEPFKNYKTCCEHCGEDDIKVELYIKCRIMLPCNNNVANGEANGTQATVGKVGTKSRHTNTTSDAKKWSNCGSSESQPSVIHYASPLQ